MRTRCSKAASDQEHKTGAYAWEAHDVGNYMTLPVTAEVLDQGLGRDLQRGKINDANFVLGIVNAKCVTAL
jgi:hypothetical protein